MVILGRIDREANHDRVQKSRVGERYAATTKIRTDIELEFVSPGYEDLIFK